MSIVLKEKRSAVNQTLVEDAFGKNSSLVRSILLSVLLVGFMVSAGVFAAGSMRSIDMTESLSTSLCIVGAGVCFFSLPFLVALYGKKQQLALIAGSVLVFSMVLLAGVIS